MIAALPRRRVLSFLAATFAAGRLAVDLVGPWDDEPEQTYPELAETLAQMELRSVRSSHPGHWRWLHYTGLISLNRRVVSFYGVGRPDLAADDSAALLAYLCQGPDGEDVQAIVGAYRTPCGRSWAVLIEAARAGGLVADRDSDGWREATLANLQAFDHAVGRRPRTCAL